ncbi:hypothetical protein ACNHKD_12230 [Methylocystis sp. JAN1]|uniref:hypothetical protein n=1 Tax=Methylocystis sp. JAN1 TaxID=3397211 RepID=UPI003FA236C7
MLGKFDEKARSRRVSAVTPAVAPFPAHRALQAKSRSILTDAVACFVATALGSLSPQALSLVDFTSTEPVAVNVDPESGKFTDRVLIGRLQPLSWEDGAEVAPPPAFAAAPSFSGDAGASADLPPKPSLAAARPARDGAPKRIERAPEPKTAEAAALPTPASAANESAAPEARAEGQGLPGSQGVLASLTPSSVSAKVAEKIWSGAKSVGGVVSDRLGWLGY